MKRFVYIMLLCLTATKMYAQKPIDISKINRTVNRSISMNTDIKSLVLHVNAGPGPGIVWLRRPELKDGDVEFEVKGSDIYQESFVGIAFHGQNDTTYEAIYFRPFNFKAEDASRKQHAVQYISMPANDWPKLRASFPLKYEQPIGQDIDPNGWFQVRIKFSDTLIRVFVNGNVKPCLEVKPITGLPAGKIGFWVGNNSAGDFRNLKMY